MCSYRPSTTDSAYKNTTENGKHVIHTRQNNKCKQEKKICNAPGNSLVLKLNNILHRSVAVVEVEGAYLRNTGSPNGYINGTEHPQHIHTHTHHLASPDFRDTKDELLEHVRANQFDEDGVGTVTDFRLH